MSISRVPGKKSALELDLFGIPIDYRYHRLTIRVSDGNSSAVKEGFSGGFQPALHLAPRRHASPLHDNVAAPQHDEIRNSLNPIPSSNFGMGFRTHFEDDGFSRHFAG